jgi:heme-degrading monooxygenase HmoA
MFVRLWQYRVPVGRAAEFAAAYGSDGPWTALFARAAGYLGTELYRDVRDVADATATGWVTVDRWTSRSDWDAFLAGWRADYDALDSELEGIADEEVELFAGDVEA